MWTLLRRVAEDAHFSSSLKAFVSWTMRPA
jgi:hypothetical protein